MEAVAGAVPILPVPRARAVLVLWNPDATIEELSAVVEGDPSLTAQVIREANAARAMPVERVATAREAVLRIGAGRARRIISDAVMQAELRDRDDRPVDLGEFWRYSIATAILAESLVGDLHERPIAFTAGLLHDLGQLVLAAEGPSRYQAVVEAAQLGADPLQAERDQFGRVHTDVGLEIARAWGLPERLAVTLGLHHEPGMPGLTGIVARAREAVLHAGYTNGLTRSPNGPAPESALDALARVGGAQGLAARIKLYRNAAAA